MKTKRWNISENVSYKIVALLITLILWVTILGSKEGTSTRMFRFDFILPPQTVITNSVPTEVELKVMGSRLALKKFMEKNEPVAVDLSIYPEGLMTARIHPENILVPNGVRVLGVNPSAISVKLEHIVTRSIPIEIVTRGSLPEGKRMVKMLVFPKEWEVAGSRGAVESLKTLKTEPIELSTIGASSTKVVDLDFDIPGITKQKATSVKVYLVVK